MSDTCSRCGKELDKYKEIISQVEVLIRCPDVNGTQMRGVAFLCQNCTVALLDYLEGWT